MIALAGYPLGLRFLVLDPSNEACAGHVAELVPGDFDDVSALSVLSERCGVVTFEFESVPVHAARFLEQRVPVYPPANALAASQDRVEEKSLFRDLGIPTPRFVAVDSLVDLRAAVGEVGLPAILKMRRLGYDGKGQRVLRAAGDIEPAWEALGSVPLILEGFVPFDREVSILSLRARDGTTAFYPLAENLHRDGILRQTLAPCGAPEREAEAKDYAARLLHELGYVGLLAVEFFEYRGGLVANEMAPRVHNSGHWTIEGAETSQFENHLRAILGLPLGSTMPIGCCAMLNLIGEMPDPRTCLQVPGAHFHDYGKRPKPGRKLGHVTLHAGDADALSSRLERLPPIL